MDVYFETQKGTKFCIELGYWDTVLEIKKKIEKYQRISVPRQTLFFRGKVLEDDLDIEHCKILQDSLVLLFVSPDPCDPNDDNDQNLQTEQSPIPSNSIGDLIYGEDLPLTTEIVLKIRPFCPVETDEITYVQDSPVRNNDQAPPSDAAKQIINGHQDSTVTAHQELQTKQSPPSDSVRENTNIEDSSVKVSKNMKKIIVTILVMPYSGEIKAVRNIHFIASPTCKVKMLRHEIQNHLRGYLNQPQDGSYFFIHKGRILIEDQSFEWNGVAHTDTVEIVPDPWLS